MFHYFLFSSYYNIKLSEHDKNISTHTLLKFRIALWSKSKVQTFFVVFLYTAPYKKETMLHTKRKPGGDSISCVYRCVPHRANPLLRPAIQSLALTSKWLLHKWSLLITFKHNYEQIISHQNLKHLQSYYRMTINKLLLDYILNYIVWCTR